MKKLAFIGIGVMGGAMALNLLKNGYQVDIYTRTKEKALEVINEGAEWYDTVAECVANKDAVITMVGYPSDVEEVYFGKDGILENAKKGAYLIDMTTTSPKLSIRISKEAEKLGLFALDAPVSGGDSGAKNASLSIMVGGDKQAFDACMPIFKCLGTNIVYEGKAGNGQHTKMANQIALAGAISGVCEAVSYAEKAGLDPQTMLDSISKGAAGSWQMTNMAPKILKEDFTPGFFIKHYIKDLKIAAEEASENGLCLNVLEKVLFMYEELAKEGMNELGTQALIKHYNK